jgi:hypothetical protein
VTILESTGADVASSQATTLTLRVADWFLREARSRVTRRLDAHAAKQILGIDGDPEIAYRSASVHSLYHDAVHPDNLDPLIALVGSDLLRGDDPNDATANLEVVQELEVPIGQSQVRFGSPTSDGGTRILFGYGEEGENNRLIRTTEPLELPFYWELEDVGDDLAFRFVRGKGKVGRPLWRIVESRTAHSHIPEIDSEKMLKTDYLLVTRVRNYLSEGWLAGKFVTSFGGAHGTGTRAAELLAADRRELAKVRVALRELAKQAGLQQEAPPCFQLLFEVDIDNDEKRGSRGRKIRLVAQALIDNSDEHWKSAANCIAPARNEWARSGYGRAR